MNLSDALQEYQKEYKKGRFTLYTAIIGYDCIQRYLGSERLLLATITEPELVLESSGEVKGPHGRRATPRPR